MTEDCNTKEYTKTPVKTNMPCTRISYEMVTNSVEKSPSHITDYGSTRLEIPCLL
jgi:hypothetical protein